jgi:hypothetical protein
LVSPTKDWSGPVHPAPLHSSEVLTAVIKASRVPADQWIRHSSQGNNPHPVSPQDFMMENACTSPSQDGLHRQRFSYLWISLLHVLQALHVGCRIDWTARHKKHEELTSWLGASTGSHIALGRETQGGTLLSRLLQPEQDAVPDIV